MEILHHLDPSRHATSAPATAGYIRLPHILNAVEDLSHSSAVRSYRPNTDLIV
jgi:hypothetical protein